MKTSNRWLFISVGVIAALVIAAVTLVLTMQNDSPLLPENTPEGVVQRYFAAIKAGEYQTAYNYLSSSAQKMRPYTEWKPYPYPYQGSDSAWQVTIGKATITNQIAKVEIVVDRFYSGSSLDNSVNSQNYSFELVQEAGAWKINQPDFLYFIY